MGLSSEASAMVVTEEQHMLGVVVFWLLRLFFFGIDSIAAPFFSLLLLLVCQILPTPKHWLFEKVEPPEEEKARRMSYTATVDHMRHEQVQETSSGILQNPESSTPAPRFTFPLRLQWPSFLRGACTKNGRKNQTLV